jgi:hypothetical protein
MLDHKFEILNCIAKVFNRKPPKGEPDRFPFTFFCLSLSSFIRNWNLTGLETSF